MGRDVSQNCVESANLERVVGGNSYVMLSITLGCEAHMATCLVVNDVPESA